MIACTKSSECGASPIWRTCTRPWSPKDCTPLKQLTISTSRALKNACCTVPDRQRLPLGNISFNGTQCTSSLGLPYAWAIQVFELQVCVYILCGNNGWLHGFSWGTVALMALLPIWCLQRLLGGFDWGCI